MKKKNIYIILFMVIVFFNGCSGTVDDISAKPGKKTEEAEIANSSEKDYFKSHNSVCAEGHWYYEETMEDMEHFSEDIRFYEDGSFSSSTWREKCEGKYKVEGNKITVSFDLYFNPAGYKQYFYDHSGTKIFELSDGRLMHIKTTYDDGKTYEDLKIYVLKENKPSRELKTLTSYRAYTSDETWNSIEISQKTEQGFYLEASCCNHRIHIGEFKGYFTYEHPDVAICYGKNYAGTEYKIIAEFKGESLRITVESEEKAEFMLFEFGMNVYLSGGYMAYEPL